MKVKCIQTNLIDSNESEVHSNKVNWFKRKSSAFKKSLLIQIKLIESNECQVHLNKANWIKWKLNVFKQI